MPFSFGGTVGSLHHLLDAFVEEPRAEHLTELAVVVHDHHAGSSAGTGLGTMFLACGFLCAH